MRIFATWFRSCPVTTRRTGGYPSLSFVIAPGLLEAAIRLLRLLDARQGRGSFAHDDQPGFLVLRSVPMHLLGEMRDERAGGHRHREARIELVARGDPPGALDHGDETVVGMKVRPAEVARLEAVHDHVQPGLFRIADEHRLVDVGGAQGPSGQKQHEKLRAEQRATRQYRHMDLLKAPGPEHRRSIRRCSPSTARWSCNFPTN